MTEPHGTQLVAGRNPDVLTCIANLSNDEVFTPPGFANQMLDTLQQGWAESNDGANIWEDPNVTFLDPFTKTGVFLREIVKRLNTGLETQIPDLQERIDHILTRQVFGIAVTELTALMARRSVYCSKRADGEHSIATEFDNPDGNIWFQRTEHTWQGGTEWEITHDEEGNEIKQYTNGKCKYCGASQKVQERGSELESHAYAFIHTDDIREWVIQTFGGNMQFDVIIGNPPYQLNDGGYGTSAAPIYQYFVNQAKTLEPRFLVMVVPSRWFAGGKHLDSFRQNMLNDNRVRVIDDYLSAADAFPGVGLKGGVCFFLWNREERGDCKVTTHLKGWEDSTVTRPLLEKGAETFVRFNQGVSILKKVVSIEGGSEGSIALPESRRFDTLVSSLRPFGFRTYFKGRKTQMDGDVVVYQNGGQGFCARTEVEVNKELIDTWKIYVGRAAPGTGNKDTYPHRVISTPFLGEPGSISTETYLCIAPFESQDEANNALSYLSCHLTRFLILLNKASQDTTRKVYKYVPIQDWEKSWTDEDLYTKYGLSEDEIEFVERIVRPMEISDGSK